MSRHISGELGGDAREIAKSARREAEHVVGVRTRGEQIDEREREHVRQVRNRGEDAVVDGGIELAHVRAARRPQARHGGDARRGSVSRERRQHDVAIDGTASRTRRDAPVCSVPAIGWPGTKRANASPRCARAAAITFSLVLPASVTIACADERPAERLEERGKFADRRRDEHEVGGGDLARPVLDPA